LGDLIEKIMEQRPGITEELCYTNKIIIGKGEMTDAVGSNGF
jgi:hypothetical protein